jgi:hypothetical protein
MRPAGSILCKKKEAVWIYSLTYDAGKITFIVLPAFPE